MQGDMNMYESGSATQMQDVMTFVFGSVMMLVMFAVLTLMIVGMWKLFEKAGRPGWASIVPFYNTYVMLEIAGRPTWWFAVILLVPVAQTVFSIILAIDFVKSFGKSLGYAVLSIVFPFVIYPVMAWDAQTRYVGPAGPEGRRF